MKYTFLEKFSKIDISQVILDGWELEARRDISGSLKNFASFWTNIDEDPDLSSFSLEHQAPLYRLTGFFLSIYGNTQNRKNYQERAKNLICRSIDIYLSLGNNYGAADAQNVLAVCYINEGALIEAEVILEQTREMFLGDCLHPVYLRNRVNFMAVKNKLGQFQDALAVIEELEIPIEFCDDYRTCAFFHEKAGIIYRGLHSYKKAVWHYNESIRYAYKIGNLLNVCVQRNNLAFLYNKIREFELAHQNINEALKLAKENELTGWMPIYLDTQALIFASEGFPELALEKIDEAISVYRNGDDYYGLTESIWNKCKFLLQLGRKGEALVLFAELIPIAEQRMGDFAVKQFSNKFSELIHIKQEGVALDDELRRFKRIEIVNAITHANHNIYDAADRLQMHPSLLIRTIDKEFPELYEELDLQNLKHFEENIKKQPETSEFSAPRKISELILQDVAIEFADDAPEQFSTFYVSAEKLPDVIVPARDQIVSVAPVDTPKPGDWLVVLDQIHNIHSIGKVEFDESLDLHFISENNKGIPIFLNDVLILGKIFGFCDFTAINTNRLRFEQINS